MEKVLGILGGMGPMATADLFTKITALTKASCDNDHLRVLIDSNAKIPDRTNAILYGGESPLPYMLDSALRLESMGAQCLIMPCNTAHYFIDDFKAALPQPLVHIIEETVLAAQRLNPEGAWMLSTHGTRASGLYQKYADKHGYTLYLPNEEQAEKAQQAIFYVKAGELDRAGAVTKALVEELWRERDLPVMTACTELPLGYAASGLPLDREVSSIGALVDACIRMLYDEVK